MPYLLAPFGDVVDTITASVFRDIVRHDVHPVPLAKVADDFSECEGLAKFPSDKGSNLHSLVQGLADALGLVDFLHSYSFVKKKERLTGEVFSVGI
jgi:hypothetical protein